jgi:hypothetical protein
MNGLITQNSTYIEDVEVTAGEAVTARPCVVWDITVVSDAGATGVVTFHDGDAATDTKVFEVRIAASTTVHCPFPRGKKFSTGLFVKSNIGGLDLSVDYD